RDASVAEALRLGRDYGNPGDYDCHFPGINARMSELHATLGLWSLARLDERIDRRAALVRTFQDTVAGIPGLRYPTLGGDDVSTYKDLTLIVDPEAFGLTVPELTAALKAEGIDSRRYYFPPIHRQKAYAHLGPSRDLPVTDDIAERVITPPLWSHMTDEDVRRVGEAVVRIHEQAAEVRAALR
ncbi:MAG TPA: DegT/DnrJ/EryC1/StrS family aminotransferase, partial [Mycobacteriales bacterium]|nr:DegT/DnrJ/EryC1/StrS family aminotransferase [Mycobacteriales bacterium]